MVITYIALRQSVRIPFSLVVKPVILRLLLALTLSLLGMSPSLGQSSGILLLQQALDLKDGLKYRVVSDASQPTDWKPVPGRLDQWLRLDLGSPTFPAEARLQILSEDLNRIANIPLDALRTKVTRLHNIALLDRTNLLPNGDFRQKQTNWQLKNALPGAYFSATNGVARVRVSSKLADSPRLLAGGLMLKEGLPYLLRFRARAGSSRNIVVTTQLDTLTADATGLRREETLSPTWKEYLYRFTAERPSTLLKGEIRVPFQYTPDHSVKKVVVAGAFNNWSGDTNAMTFDGKTWRTTLTLPPGNHQYKLKVDDTWENDPTAPLVNDGEGHMNNLLRIPYANQLAFLVGNTPGTVEIKDIAVQPDYAAIAAEVRRPLTLADFTSYAVVQVPVTLKGRSAFDLAVSLEAAGQSLPAVTLSAQQNGVAVFENVPQNTPLTVILTHGQESMRFPGKQADALNGMVAGITVPENWVGVPTLASVPMLRPVNGSGQPAAPVVILPSGASSSENRFLYTLAGFLSAVALILVGVVWMLETRRRAMHTGPAPKSGPSSSRSSTAILARTPAPSLVGAERPKTVPLPEAVAVGRVSQMSEAGSRLVGVTGAYTGYSFALAPGFTEIGRDISRGVALPQDHNVSRKHAAIQYLDGEYIVTDEGSSNGTFINGIRIAVSAPHPIKPGDEVQFGTSRFRFEV